VNIVFLRGRLSRPAEVRVLGSGTTVVNYEVTVAHEGAPKDSVPVIWQDPPPSARAGSFAEGDEVVVLGRVRRRFFKAGGTTQSRTEVVAETFLPARQAKKVAAAIDEYCEVLAEATG
jgi:single-strand DNA-binding protein